MVYNSINKRLIAVHIGQWLPLLGIALLIALGSEKESGALVYLPLILIPVSWLLTLVFVLRNLIRALRTLAAGFDSGILRAAKRHKLAMIPYFFLSVSFWAILPMGMLNPWLVWFIPFLIPLSVLGLGSAWLTMLSTSGYVIAQIVLLRQNGTFTIKQCGTRIVLQLLPVTSLLGCIALSKMPPTPSPDQNQSQCCPAQAPAA